MSDERLLFPSLSRAKRYGWFTPLRGGDRHRIPFLRTQLIEIEGEALSSIISRRFEEFRWTMWDRFEKRMNMVFDRIGKVTEKHLPIQIRK